MIASLIEKAKAVDVGVAVDNKTSFDGFASYVQAIYHFSLILGGSLTVLMIIYAGYIYLTSRGDTSKITQAKDIILGAILGFVLLYIIGVVLDFMGMPKMGI